ncbi:MAG TPA: terminase small subunit [Candidatus Obscuribacterales bacterium]
MAGRPTDYNEEVQAKADEYVGGGYIECGDVVPSIAGLACELHKRRTLLYAWADKHPAFKDTLETIQEVQERKLLSGSLSGQHNATIAKLMLANHGYSDKQSQEITGPKGGPIQTQWIIQPVAAKHANPSDS